MELKDLWIGADFNWKNQRYCKIDIDDLEDVVAVKISYDEASATGNPVVTFSKYTEVEYRPRRFVLPQDGGKE